MKHHNSIQLLLFKRFANTATVTLEAPCYQQETAQSKAVGVEIYLSYYLVV